MALCKLGSLRKGLSSPSSFPSVLFAAFKRNQSSLSAGSNGQERGSSLNPNVFLNHSTTTDSKVSEGNNVSFSQPQLLSHFILQSTLSKSPLHPHEVASVNLEMEYKCPSRLPENFSQMVILDNTTAIKSFYDCPVSTSIVDNIEAPNKQKPEVLEGPGKSSPAMEAKIIMKIRHKKMKKHKLKKLRKRMYFLWRKQKLARRAKRMAIYKKELEEIKKTGDDFNAENFIREQLAKARQGGYYRNVFESKV